MAVYTGASVTFIGNSNVMHSNIAAVNKGKNIFSISSNLNFNPVCKPSAANTLGNFAPKYLEEDLNECGVITCSCLNGVAATGTACTSNGANICASCSDGYHKSVENVRECIVNNCEPTQVANSNKADFTSIAGTVGQTVEVTCLGGYKGGGTATCGTSGQFNALTCSAKSCASTKVAHSDKAVDGSIAGKVASYKQSNIYYIRIQE
jgi:hypothetical protein